MKFGPSFCGILESCEFVQGIYASFLRRQQKNTHLENSLSAPVIHFAYVMEVFKRRFVERL